MTKTLMEALVQAGADLNIPVRPYPEYHGRYMNDQTTCGIVLESLLKLPAVAAMAIANEDSRFNGQRMIGDLLHLRSDDMGHDTIVY